MWHRQNMQITGDFNLPTSGKDRLGRQKTHCYIVNFTPNDSEYTVTEHMDCSKDNHILGHKNTWVNSLTWKIL